MVPCPVIGYILLVWWCTQVDLLEQFRVLDSLVTPVESARINRAGSNSVQWPSHAHCTRRTRVCWNRRLVLEFQNPVDQGPILHAYYVPHISGSIRQSHFWGQKQLTQFITVFTGLPFDVLCSWSFFNPPFLIIIYVCLIYRFLQNLNQLHTN